MSANLGLTIDTVHLAMGLEQSRAKIAARNIAMANIPGSRATRLDVAAPLSNLRAARSDAAQFAQALQQLRNTDPATYQQSFPIDAPLALDGEVAELSAASGRFQALADGVSRQFALMQLAIKGGR